MISIIIPCYNGETVLRDAIQSVLQQTYIDWELIIVDDCSSDNSSNIIQAFAAEDPRIKYYKTNYPSGSPSLPRNIGLENIKGDFIAFLDSDDIWLPDKLSNQLAFMEKHGYDVSYSYYEKISWNGIRNNRIIKTRGVTNYKSLLTSNSIPCLTSMISRKAVGNTRFKSIPQEDFCFWLDILRKGYVAYNMCESTALYRESKSSRSANKLDMFKGYWRVIRNHQNLSFPKSCWCMIPYTILGFLKYIK